MSSAIPFLATYNNGHQYENLKEEVVWNSISSQVTENVLKITLYIVQEWNVDYIFMFRFIVNEIQSPSKLKVHFPFRRCCHRDAQNIMQRGTKFLH